MILPHIYRSIVRELPIQILLSLLFLWRIHDIPIVQVELSYDRLRFGWYDNILEVMINDTLGLGWLD